MIEPVFANRYGVLHQGDCMDVFAAMRARSVSCVFADPPKPRHFYEKLHRRVRTTELAAERGHRVGLVLQSRGTWEIKLHRVDSWRKIAAVASQHTVVAA